MRPPPFISVESITTLIGNNSWPQCSLDSHYLDSNIPRDPAPVASVNIDRALSWTFGLQSYLLSKITAEHRIPHDHIYLEAKGHQISPSWFSGAAWHNEMQASHMNILLCDG